EQRGRNRPVDERCGEVDHERPPQSLADAPCGPALRATRSFAGSARSRFCFGLIVACLSRSRTRPAGLRFAPLAPSSAWPGGRRSEWREAQARRARPRATEAGDDETEAKPRARGAREGASGAKRRPAGRVRERLRRPFMINLSAPFIDRPVATTLL